MSILFMLYQDAKVRRMVKFASKYVILYTLMSCPYCVLALSGLQETNVRVLHLLNQCQCQNLSPLVIHHLTRHLVPGVALPCFGPEYLHAAVWERKYIRVGFLDPAHVWAGPGLRTMRCIYVSDQIIS